MRDRLELMIRELSVGLHTDVRRLCRISFTPPTVKFLLHVWMYVGTTGLLVVRQVLN